MIAPVFLLASLLAQPIVVVDGDTLRAGGERIRLLGIDAPELHGCKPRGRICAPGDGMASKRSLEKLAVKGPVTIERIKQDRYGRTVAIVWSGRTNLSCAQLRRQQAIYKPKWDDGRRIARECPLSNATKHDVPRSQRW